jgi:GNAT superfamily N-acetyltransferase
VDTATLATLEHENMLEVVHLFGAHVPGALVRVADGILIDSSRLPFLLFNQVLVADEAARPEAMAAAVAVMHERGGRFCVNLRLGPDDRFVALMNDLGLVQLSVEPWMPGMAWHPLPSAADLSEGPPAEGPVFEIRRESDWSGIETHIATGAAGFGMPAEVLGQVFGPGLLERDDVAVYVGYADGQPVATGMGLRTGRTIGVYNIATIESARGRGFGGAMSRRIVADGVIAGCDVAILQSSDMGKPLYERLGFRTVVEYMAWVEPRAPAAGDDHGDEHG